MIYYCPDDPEAGYFDDWEVDECAPHWCGLGHLYCTGYITDTGLHVERAYCSICEAEIHDEALYPLCERCEATARAHARHERDREEWIADGSPR